MSKTAQEAAASAIAEKENIKEEEPEDDVAHEEMAVYPVERELERKPEMKPMDMFIQGFNVNIEIIDEIMEEPKEEFEEELEEDFQEESDEEYDEEFDDEFDGEPEDTPQMPNRVIVFKNEDANEKVSQYNLPLRRRVRY